MSHKQKVLAGVITAVVVVGFVFIYSRLSVQAPSQGAMDASAVRKIEVADAEKQSREAAIPSTPDAAVDAIIDDAALDDQALSGEVDGEKAAITASGEEINNLSQTYDENQL